MTMGISIPAYARHRGALEAAVRKAISAGRITPESDSTISPELADEEGERNTQAPRQGTQQRAVRVRGPDAPAPGCCAVDGVTRT